ncbi:MAG: peptidylprolyl isomerase, partial [Candidatus Omnitrophica bacterium]|nr:peptidylprolyl isomerase [Candidatus Omnitrophota bacterium]
MVEHRICPICKREFLPNKYRKGQRVCSRSQCQRQRQLRNLAAWRKRNPGYFKISRHDSSWAKIYRQRSQMWRRRHKTEVKRYKKAHKEEQKEYMREYMYRRRMEMGKFLISLVLVLSFTQLCGCGEGRAPSWFKFGRPSIEKRPELEEVEGTALASVNGRLITLEDFNGRIQAYNDEIQASADIPDSVKSNYLIETVEDKKRLLEGMVERELIVAEALERRLDKDTELRKAIKALEEQLLFAKMVEVEKAKVDVTTKEAENYYELYKDVFTVSGERRASMIVVPTEAKAKEILIALLQGGDFAALARLNSTDKSAGQGGDIGFIVQKMPFPQPDKKTMFEKFEEVAFTLELN